MIQIIILIRLREKDNNSIVRKIKNRSKSKLINKKE